MTPNVRIASLPNLGPKSAQMLRAAGIRTRAQLEKQGAIKAFVKVCAVDERASLNLLWALEAALSGRTWQEVARNDRLRLLLAVEDYMRRRRKPRPIKRRAVAR